MARIPDPPLGLYIHLPWCIRKCPYCDFNSYGITGDARARQSSFAAYTDALLRELQEEAKTAGGRPLISIYLGGGTPSLFPPAEIHRLLRGVKSLLDTAPDCEVSMEANPGTVTPESLLGYREAGVNRLSLGIQSLDDAFLKRLSRIHSRDEAFRAIEAAGKIFDNYNLDLMHSLPGQDTAAALSDLAAALEFHPPHLSWYQLTPEEDTPFGRNTPELPDEETTEEICLQGFQLLAEAGYRHYEISAFTRDRPCIHNRNYWKFGDYLALGAGAHSKITLSGKIIRKSRQPRPGDYIKAVTKAPEAAIRETRIVAPEDLLFEYLLNRLRLFEDITRQEFEDATGLSFQDLRERLRPFRKEGLISESENSLALTSRGALFVNRILEDFL
ncbi:radical SAM family heme chaperone HemW [Succinimonas sp.]|uniref:radical SAM family heme chaperone HemW n=1 Tax=Succinimonas sp. TaxID=1936151 RepID=UPI003864EB20